jgi:hypothetical protein
VIINEGDPTGVHCPRAKCDEEIVYNGNYFCPAGHWHAPENWLDRHPEAYANLMDYRARKRMIPVEELINFNADLYERGAL